MKIKWLVGVTLAASMAAPAFAQVGIYIGRNPPPVRYERRPASPGPGYAWIDGYWGTQNNRYVWVPGRYDRQPYEGAYWTHPHYDHYQEGWRMHEGHWDREDHGDRYDHHDQHDQRDQRPR